MTRLVLLSVVAVGLMYAAYTSLLTAEFGGSDNTTRAEPLPLAQGTPWTEIDPAARNSSHAIVPDLSPTVALASLNSPIEVENYSPTANAQATATEQTDHIKIISPASIREGPSTSSA